MSRRLKTPLPQNLLNLQRRASDPETSAWVRANAGSGKTHVLTQRVLRLLLSGARPEEILCLTYTKAAAAEMRRRVGENLGAWALLEEPALIENLTALEGRVPGPERLVRARTLFAHALETPGGLKINTIHAFCESVLHRFPLEAGVPFDFTVIEEAEAEDMVRRARESVLAGGLKAGAEHAAAVETLFELMSDFTISEAIDAALAQGRKLRAILIDRDGAKRRLRQHVRMPDGETRAQILIEAIGASLFPASRYGELFAHLPPDPAKTKSLNLSERLAAISGLPPDGVALFGAFLKDGGMPYKDRATTKIRDAALAAAVGAEHDRLEALYPAYRRATLVERSEALLDVLGAIAERYEAQKRARSRLDFDDLIERLGRLFADETQSGWVRYKLDAGITHILVDESQDTNPEQWRVVEELAGEFFAGDGAIGKPRTVFAVGDEKQSIFSFQGAEPALFGKLGRRYAIEAAAVERPFAPVRLHTSFRTLPGILNAVDKVFEAPALKAAVLSDGEPVQHDTARADSGGTVTLWAPLRQPAAPATEQWPETAPENLSSAPRQLAERIAREIAAWIGERRPLGGRGRPVRPEDVLILVQSRSALFIELIRALNRAGIATPGADRLEVTGHIGVLDLMALGDVLVNSADDLQLAALLRSPLFEVTEDELRAIAAGRAGTLWRALEGSALPTAQAAFAALRRWRGRLDFDRPFEFYAEILYAQGGLKRFHGRLGGEIDDVLAEFLTMALEHEQTAQPSLQGFLAAMRSRAVSIKRELSDTGRGVRVMTVHGAKGLEAPIVILADAASRPQGRQLTRPVSLELDAPGPLFIHGSAARDHVPETLQFRQAEAAAQEAEYWRKLYVGMTRAEDELYITGVLTRKAKLEGTWYAAIEAALGGISSPLTGPDGEAAGYVFPREPAPATPTAATPTAAMGETPADAPLLLAPLPRVEPLTIITPSSAGKAGAVERVYDTAAASVGSAEAARQGGIALHALLQHLGGLPRESWQKVVEKALPVLLPDDRGQHAALGQKAVAILSNPAFAELFGPDSRAEVPFLIEAKQHGKPVRLAGRIDRMVVAKGRILVVDYKSDAVPAKTASEVPAPYLTQVGLYAYVASQLFPGLVVEAGILWTTLESLMILPQTALRDAVLAFTMR